MAREVGVPETFTPLQELQIVLHLAFCEGLNGDGALDGMSSKQVCDLSVVDLLLGEEAHFVVF